MPNLPAQQQSGATVRNCLRQPYPSTDVWNIPIGAGATYSLPQPTATQTTLFPATSSDLHLSHTAELMDPTQPLTPVQVQQPPVSGQTNCSGTGTVLATVPIYPFLSIPGGSSNNYGVTFVHADGHTIDEGAAFASCVQSQHYVTVNHINLFTNKSSNLNALSASTVNGPAAGSTGAAQTPSGAGVIRIGELVPGGVIAHALQMILSNENCYQTSIAANSYRWPATKADAYYATDYTGTNPRLTMGARLALRPQDGIPAKMQTPMGVILATAFQNYGGIVVNTGGGGTAPAKVNFLCTEVSGQGVGSYSQPTLTGDVETEFAAVWNSYSRGIQMAISGVGALEPWPIDVRLIFKSLYIVGDISSTNLARQNADYASYQAAITNYATGTPSKYTGMGGGAPLVPFSPDLGTVGGITAPGVPVLTLTAGNNSVTLNWTAPNNGGDPIIDYNAQYGTTSSGPWTTIADAGTALTVTQGSLTAGTAYWFRVRAVNTIGGAGSYCTPLSATPDSAERVPGAPQGTTAIPGSTAVTLDWSAPLFTGGGAGLTDYLVQYRTSGTPSLSAAISASSSISGLITRSSVNPALSATIRASSTIRGAISSTKPLAGKLNVVFIPLENKPFQVPGSSFPLLSAIINPGYAWHTNFFCIDTPSGPNYQGVTFGTLPGDSQFFADDSFHNINLPSIYRALTTAGLKFGGFAEGLTSASVLTTEGGNPQQPYACRHFAVSYDSNFNGNGTPILYGPDANGSLVRNAGSVGTAFGKNGSTTNFTGTSTFSAMITDMNSGTPANFYYGGPCLTNQAHGNTCPAPWSPSGTITADCDGFMAHMVSLIQATSWYANHGNIIFWWDEGSHPPNASQTNLVLINEGPAKGHGAISTGKLDHTGLLQDLLTGYGIKTPVGHSNAQAGSILKLLDLS